VSLYKKLQYQSLHRNGKLVNTDWYFLNDKGTHGHVDVLLVDFHIITKMLSDQQI
jgi:hypothetical protein